jgi:hypothetical protein
VVSWTVQASALVALAVPFQAISVPDHRFDEYARHCDWIQKWIFPGYLSTCEAAFETRSLGNLQLVLSRDLNRALPGIPAAAVRAA